jgi:release factor glutamine methyltransferase
MILISHKKILTNLRTKKCFMPPYLQKLTTTLTPIYGPGEAASIARIVVEDVPDIDSRFDEILARLLQREPVQYILGQADFYGLKFEVNRHTLIPRQETEELVYAVLEDFKKKDLTGKRLLDVGAGSGCIPIVLKKKLPALEIVSVDVSEEALAVARRNAARHGVEVGWRRLDFLDEQNWPALGAFDIVVSNPPYIDPSESALMPPHVLDYEPAQALFTQAHPLEFYRAIARFCQKNFHRGRKFFCEINEFRAEEVEKVFREQGIESPELISDMQGKARIIRGLC